MKNAIIIHGTSDKEEYYSPDYPSASNSHWLPWLQKQLIIRYIPAVATEVPNSYMPDYAVWKRELERFEITPETLLIGPSCGGGFLVRWLSENKIVTVGKKVISLDPMGIRRAEPGIFLGVKHTASAIPDAEVAHAGSMSYGHFADGTRGVVLVGSVPPDALTYLRATRVAQDRGAIQAASSKKVIYTKESSRL